ncbi:MAG: MFS transporter [Geminicoccaceae bacterium]|nr:MFS transporter [Geminicoccaceae bacterium]
MDRSGTVSTVDIAAAHRGIAAVFLLNGMALGSWAANLPSIKARLAIDEAQLGLALLVMGGGAVLAMVLAGPFIDRRGSRGLTLWSGLVMAMVLPLSAFVPSWSSLLVAAFLLGTSNGIMDVAMNAHGLAVERQLARPVMSMLHGCFSLGGIVAAVLVGGSLTLGFGLQANLVAVSLLLFVALLQVGRSLLPASVENDGTGHGAGGGVALALPTGPLLPVALMALVGFLAEGSMIDWAAVYLRESLSSGEAVAAFGFGVFAGAMAIGRFLGDRIIARFGRLLVLRVSALLAVSGFATALLPQGIPTAFLGYALVGFGVANIVPILFSAGGSMPGFGSGTGVAAVATAGYGGALTGPALIGFLASATSLRVALATGAVLLIVIPLFARRALRPAGFRPVKVENPVIP